MAKYTSGNQLNLKIGVESHSESLTSLEVIGRVGIGTTSATVPLDVVGDVNVSGAITAASFTGDGSGLTNIPGTSFGPDESINTTGIITASEFHGDGSNLTGLTASDVGALAGVSIREEGSVVGTAGSVGDINFVSGNLTVTASGIGATITLSDTPTFTSIDATGIITASSSVVGSAVTINSTGIDAGVGVITASSFVGDGSNLTGLTASDVGALAGVSIREEGFVVGTAGSVGDINFVSTNLTATASGIGATVTLSDTPEFTSVVVGSAVTINSTGIDAGVGVITASSFVGDGSSLTGVGGGLFVSNDTGIHTTSNVGVGTTTANGAADSNNTTILNAGIVTANFYYGDGSNLTGLTASASSGEFYTGITSSVQITPLSYETSVFTFPSTAGKQYVIESINVANVDTSVGVGTTVNIIASIEDATAGEQTYIAYNVPIVNGGVIELLKNPIVAGPSDVIKMWTTNENYIGVNTAAEVYMNYDEFTSTDYVKTFASTVSIATTDVTGILTSTSNPTVIESIHLANRTDTGDYPVSVRITQGTSTSHLVKDLLIPRYSTVDILDRPKRIETNGIIQVKVEQTSTIDVIVAGKKITS